MHSIRFICERNLAED